MSYIFHNLQLDSLYTDVKLTVSVYSDNGNTALFAMEPSTGETIAVLTVNINMLPPNILHIKNYSENDGALDWLLKNKIVELMPFYDTQTVFVEAQGVKLVHDGLKAAAEKAREDFRKTLFS